MAHLGIDIGGTKTLMCLGTLDGEILAEERFSTYADAPFSVQLNAMYDLAEQLRKKHDIESIGISHPGPISIKQGLILSPPNLKKWHNTPIVELIKKQFNLPVFFQNDANAAALAEFYFGSHKKSENLIYLTASTGMGGGIIINSKLIEGRSDTAGEIGHMILDPNGPECPCGMRGCFEAFCGGAAFAKRVSAAAKKTTTSLKGTLSVRTIIAAAKGGDLFALAAWDEFTSHFAQGIGTLLMTLNPDVIILGTIARHAGDFLLKPLREKLKKYAWSEAIQAATIEASTLGDKLAPLSALATIKSRWK